MARRLLAGALTLGVAAAAYYTPHLDEQQATWIEYKRSFAKDYGTIASDHRAFITFVENLRLIDERNEAELAVGGEPVHGLTPLVDMSQQEYEEAMLDDRDILKVRYPLLPFVTLCYPRYPLLPSLPRSCTATASFVVSVSRLTTLSFTFALSYGQRAPRAQAPGANLRRRPRRHHQHQPGAVAVEMPFLEPPFSSDWSGVATMPVRNQGSCSSGYAFAASAQIESDAFRAHGVRYILSPGQLVSCDAKSNGCRGGSPESTYVYVQRAKGLERESTAPYVKKYSEVGVPPSCTANGAQFVVGVTGAYSISGPNERSIEGAMAGYVNKTGPVVACTDATNWNTYAGGVMRVRGGGMVNHCLQVRRPSVRWC